VRESDPPSGPSRAGFSRAYRLAASMTAAGAVTLGIAACVSSVPSPVSAPDGVRGSPGQAAPPTAAAKAAAAQQTAIAPLTGLPVSARDVSRPAVALVVAGSRPQGLGSADIVFEEITTPLHRYIAVFQSRQAGPVGPITSTRPVDGMALSVLHPLLGYDGGTPGFLDVLQQTKVIALGYQDHASLYQAAPGGVTASTAAISHAARGTAPPPLYLFRGTGPGDQRQLAAGGVRRVTQVQVRTPGGGQQSWQFDARSNRWLQTGGGPRAAVSNLIIQTVRYRQVFLSHKYGITAPSARVIGRGPALVITGNSDAAPPASSGLAAAGTWSKPGLAAVTNYLDRQNIPMALQPGPSWVILAPPGTTVRTT
jgi:hypothetical protein